MRVNTWLRLSTKFGILAMPFILGWAWSLTSSGDDTLALKVMAVWLVVMGAMALVLGLFVAGTDPVRGSD